MSGDAAVAVRLGDTVKAPEAPAVCDCMVSVDSPFLVTTLAVTPGPAARIREVAVRVLPVGAASASVDTPFESVVTLAVTPVGPLEMVEAN